MSEMKSEEGISTHAIYEMASDDYGHYKMTQIRILVIRNLAKKTSYSDLDNCLSAYGNIEHYYVCKNHKKSDHAFVIFFTTAADAMRAIEDANGKHIRLHNRDLEVMFADSWYQLYDKQKFYMWKKSNKKRKTSSDLVISNLNKRTTYKDLISYFSIYGHVKCCYVCKKYKKNGYAFVIFTKAADAIRAMKDANGKHIRLHNRHLRMIPAYSWCQFYDTRLKSYIMQKKLNKKKKIASEQCTQVCLENDIAKTSIHMLNDYCLTHIFLFLPIVDRVRIERVCKRWRHLSQGSWYAIKRLDLLQSTWGFSPRDIYTDTFHKILLKCGRFLTQITFSGNTPKLSKSIFNVIRKLCPNLTDIDISLMQNYVSSIRALAYNFRNIKKLNLGRLWNLSDNDELKNLFKLNQNLEYIACIGCMESKTLLYLPEQMHTIILEKCEAIHDYFFPMTLQRFENLKHLTINDDFHFRRSRNDVAERTLEVLGKHCKNLTVLKLEEFASVETTDMLHLTHLVNLQVLKVTYNSGISDEFLANLVKRCQQLVSLDITGCCSISNNGLNAIATLLKLEKLIISYIDSITDHSLMKMCNLKELECRKCTYFSDQGISMFIKSSSQLKLLDLSGCKYITKFILEVAKDACDTRFNNVILKIIAGGTSIDFNQKVELSPLLQIVNSNY